MSAYSIVVHKSHKTGSDVACRFCGAREGDDLKHPCPEGTAAILARIGRGVRQMAAAIIVTGGESISYAERHALAIEADLERLNARISL